MIRERRQAGRDRVMVARRMQRDDPAARRSAVLALLAAAPAQLRRRAGGSRRSTAAEPRSAGAANVPPGRGAIRQAGARGRRSACARAIRTGPITRLYPLPVRLRIPRPERACGDCAAAATCTEYRAERHGDRAAHALLVGRSAELASARSPSVDTALAFAATAVRRRQFWPTYWVPASANRIHTASVRTRRSARAGHSRGPH